MYSEDLAFLSLISKECRDIENLLLEKNRKYNNSVLNPSYVFSRSDPIEQINVRIDDKLARIKSNQKDDDEDAEKDLIGYLILKRAVKQYQKSKDTTDSNLVLGDPFPGSPFTFSPPTKKGNYE